MSEGTFSDVFVLDFSSIVSWLPYLSYVFGQTGRSKQCTQMRCLRTSHHTLFAIHPSSFRHQGRIERGSGGSIEPPFHSNFHFQWKFWINLINLGHFS